jgi:hypothetical protein
MKKSVATFSKALVLVLLGGVALGIAINIFLDGPQNLSYKLVSIFLLLTLFSNLIAKAVIAIFDLLQSPHE